MVNVSTNLVLELEFKNKELLKKEKLIHELQRREREMTDRSVYTGMGVFTYRTIRMGLIVVI